MEQKMESKFDQMMSEWRKGKKKSIVANGESIHEHEVYCPHCGHIDQEYWECNPRQEEWTTNECGKCEKKFGFKMEYVFSTRKMET
jgi:transcription elongation factor Elf1